MLTSNDASVNGRSISTLRDGMQISLPGVRSSCLQVAFFYQFMI
ncbi:hypothetical protein T02_6998 [Trichinella nativa]|uniref:Uncharacterized protein n=1 Tax=Trichinella nativa TaxID=6335 RepID=A0A0V1KHI5_9BILA|nr:hypothetical protein T02_6998 [Trichinella nativa]